MLRREGHQRGLICMISQLPIMLIYPHQLFGQVDEFKLLRMSDSTRMIDLLP